MEKVITFLTLAIEFIKLLNEAIRIANAWLKSSKKNEDLKKLREGIEKNDTSLIEEALGSENAGKPSTDDNPTIVTGPPKERGRQ